MHASNGMHDGAAPLPGRFRPWRLGRALPRPFLLNRADALPLALVVVGAMALACAASGALGALVPMTLRRLGADPAMASTIFLTTATDVASIGLLLGLATWLVL